jgi:hypothetical protein
MSHPTPSPRSHDPNCERASQPGCVIACPGGIPAVCPDAPAAGVLHTFVYHACTYIPHVERRFGPWPSKPVTRKPLVARAKIG